MTTPDIHRRVDHQAEDIRVISDLVLDVKGTVDELKTTVAEHGRELAAIKATQAEHGKALAEILGLLRQGR